MEAIQITVGLLAGAGLGALMALINRKWILGNTQNIGLSMLSIFLKMILMIGPLVLLAIWSVSALIAGAVGFTLFNVVYLVLIWRRKKGR